MTDPHEDSDLDENQAEHELLSAWYERLRDLWSHGRLSESAAVLDEGERSWGPTSLVQLCRARQLAQEELVEAAPGRVDRARSLVADATRELGTPPDEIVKGAVVLLDLGDVRGAARLLQRLPSQPSNYLALRDQAAVAHIAGTLMARAGDVADAEEQFRAAILGDPVVPDYHAALAELLARTGRYEDARATIENGLGQVPADPGLLSLRKQMAAHPRLPG